MESNRKVPIGIELVRRGVITEAEVNKAIEYQKTHKKMKLGEILRIVSDCNDEILIKEIGDILGEKGILLTFGDINLDVQKYISLDIAKECKVIPFDIEQGRIKVCFSDVSILSS